MSDDALRMARLLRPFPTKKLADCLYHVQADAASIQGKLTALLIDPPTVPERWLAELESIDELLWSLSERCAQARPEVEQMKGWAAGDFNRAVTAMTSIMRGLSEQEWQSAEPEETAA